MQNLKTWVYKRKKISKRHVAPGSSDSSEALHTDGSSWLQLRYKKEKSESISAVILGLVALSSLKVISAMLFGSIALNSIVIGVTITAIVLDWPYYCRAIPAIQSYYISFVIILAIDIFFALQCYPYLTRYLSEVEEAAKYRTAKLHARLLYRVEKKLVGRFLAGDSNFLEYIEEFGEIWYYSAISAPVWKGWNKSTETDERGETSDSENTSLLKNAHHKHNKNECKYLNLVHFQIDITESWVYCAYLVMEVIASAWWLVSVILTPVGLDDSIEDCADSICNKRFELIELYVMNYLYLLSFAFTFVRVGSIIFGIFSRTYSGMRVIRYYCHVIDALISECLGKDQTLCSWIFDNFFYRNPDFMRLTRLYLHELPGSKSDQNEESNVQADEDEAPTGSSLCDEGICYFDVCEHVHLTKEDHEEALRVLRSGNIHRAIYGDVEEARSDEENGDQNTTLTAEKGGCFS